MILSGCVCGWQSSGLISKTTALANIAMELPASSEPESQIVYWHRELPPLDAQFLGEHTLEAASMRVPGTLAHRDELWDQCYEDLMVQARLRLEQEVARLGGHYAHVLDEAVDSRHDPVQDEAWLHGVFTYSLYRRDEKGGEKGVAKIASDKAAEKE